MDKKQKIISLVIEQGVLLLFSSDAGVSVKYWMPVQCRYQDSRVYKQGQYCNRYFLQLRKVADKDYPGYS